MTGRHGLGALLVAAAIAVAACSGSGGTPAPATPAAPAASPSAAAAGSAAPQSGTAKCEVGGTAATTTEIKNFSFQSGLTVKAGEAITFTNGDSTAHTVTMDDGSCDTGRIEAGASATVKFDTPGTYAFHCKIHPSMKATVVVSG